MKQRVAFAWDNLGPTHADRIEACARSEVLDVHVVQFFARSDTYGWDAPDISLPHVRTLFGGGVQVSPWRLALALARALLRTRARTVFLCHYERWPVLFAALMLRLCGRRVIAMTDSKFDDYARHMWREIIKRLYLAPYNGALTASGRSREYLRFLGFRRRPIELGYDSLSVSRIVAQAEAVPAPDGVPHADRDFVVIARLVPKKNLGLALDAYAMWRARGGAGRRLVLLGSGPLEAELRARAERLGIADGVDFRGFVQTGAVSAALSRALCLILPSIEEQFGLVVIEAMALGVPALVSRNAGAVDVLLDNGVNGFAIDPHDPATLAALMDRLATDAAAWRAMALAARAAADRGDARHFARAVQALSA